PDQMSEGLAPSTCFLQSFAEAGSLKPQIRRRKRIMSKLAGKSIMITGGAQGIGEGIARRLAADGASVAIADLKIDQAKEVAESLKAEGAKAIGVQVDVADRGQVQAAIKKVVDS